MYVCIEVNIYLFMSVIASYVYRPWLTWSVWAARGVEYER